MVEKQPQSLPVVRQRLDKWLFFARLMKSRSLAQKAIETGDISVNDARVKQPSYNVKAGDRIVVSLERSERIVKVLLPGHRRGPYEEACLLYEDLTPAPVAHAERTAFAQATRERGSGRPTKKERREVDWLQSGPDWRED